LAAWSAALLVLCITAAASGHDPLSTATWEHWDSGHYESIALGGYDVHRCAPGETDSGARWCGNAAWFPAYPWLLAALHLLGLPIGVAGIAVAWAFALAALLLLWHAFLRLSPKPFAASALLYAAFTPGLVYEYAVFPLSMFVTFTVGFLALLYRGRWLAAGLAGFAAALTYPIGVMVAPVVAFAWALLRARGNRTRAVVLAAVPPAGAFAVVAAVQRVQTGRWRAFFDVQAQYAHGFHDPFGVTENVLLPLARASQPFTHDLAASWQTLLVALTLAALGVHAALRRRHLALLDPLILLFAAIAWALPLIPANVSVWRSQTALAPVALLVARLPRPLAASVIVASVIVNVALARLFFEGRLI
jgi:hypothetical protein